MLNNNHKPVLPHSASSAQSHTAYRVHTERKKSWYGLGIILLFFFLFPHTLQPEDRVPRPEFKSNYQTPRTNTPLPREDFFEYLDVGVLFLTLAVASYLALKKRSRNGLLLCTLFSFLYFGFWRRGCVCAVGSIQNIALALFNPAYVIPLTVILFFLLPLLFALFYGRTFCAAVCPLGAIQELAALKPQPIPSWLNKGLSIVPVIYLAISLLFAITGSEFIICKYDPFIGFYRFGAYFEMIVYGLIMLVIGVFIARPYCRFLCPYGVLIGWMSSLSGRHVTITPDHCIHCGLCANTCPVGAIKTPLPEETGEDKRKGIKRLALLLCLLPVLSAGTGFVLSSLAPLLYRAHPAVQTALQVKAEDTGVAGETTLESETFRASGKTLDALYQEADHILQLFKTWGWIIGSCLGILLGLKLIRFSTWKKQADYEPDNITCVSCGRCFASCPREQLRIRRLKEKSS